MERLTRQDVDDILVEFDTMDYMPTNLCENAEFERNQYKGKLVKMAEDIIDYKNLEEQIGCPFDVRNKIHTYRPIYDEKERYIVSIMDCSCFIATSQNNGSKRMFKYKDYKKTWWLKADRSE